jgi:hypothetical protein
MEQQNIIVAVVYAGWELLYFAYSWSVGGKTFGMAVLGIEVVRSDGADLDPRRAVIRTLALPLSFLLCGLGFAGILFQREHRALHDLIAGTAVVYSWDARAARLRFLARQGRVGQAVQAAGTRHPAPGTERSSTNHPQRVTCGIRRVATVTRVGPPCEPGRI